VGIRIRDTGTGTLLRHNVLEGALKTVKDDTQKQ
jgi:hypothetical protein